MKGALVLLAVLLLPVVAADTLTEDFQGYFLGGFEPETVPDQDWYDYAEGATIGEVSTADPDIIGTQHMRFEASTTEDPSARRATFSLEVPAQLLETTFYVKGVPYATNSEGSQQRVSIDSSAPVRTMVQFFLFCNDSANPTGCQFKVKWQNVDTTGQELVAASAGLTQFKVRVVPEWLNSTFRLYVNDVDDGWFPFLELPRDVGRLQFNQQRGDVPLNMSFDDWTVIGTVNGTGGAVGGDIANGIKNFATGIRFTTTGSKFFFGFLLFVVLVAAVVVPLLSLGRDNTLVPAIGFFAVLAVLWMVFMEFWPDWIGIALIVLVAALVGTLVRRLVLGIKDASKGPGLVAGSMGYFIIATSLLAFSGYATATIDVPSAPVDQTEDAGGIIAADQSFLEATTECIFSGAVFTFGLVGDCSQDTQTSTWKKITDALGWARAGLNFLFQLLTFQLPIPVIFNVIIVLPPAAALATLAIQTIRGVGA